MFLVMPNRKASLIAVLSFSFLLGLALFRNSEFFNKIVVPISSRCLICGTFFCALLGTYFYNTWCDSYLISIASDLFHLSEKYILLLCTFICIIVAAPMCSYILSIFSRIAKEQFATFSSNISDTKRTKFSGIKTLFILSLIYLVGISAILKANFNYIDDQSRVLQGYKGWNDFSRILSYSLSTFVHSGNYLTDISPLPQVLAILLLALGSMILLYSVSECTSFSLGQLIAVIPLALNPYFLECLSYKFDSPYMALSVFSGIVPIFFRKAHPQCYIIICVLSSIAVCTTYQAASGIFPMLVIWIALRMWSNNTNLKETGKFIAHSAMGYLLGLVFFKTVILIPVDTYASSQMFTLHEFIPGFFSNLVQYYRYVYSDFNSIWRLSIGMLVLSFLYTSVCSSKRSKLSTLVVSCAALVLMCLICFGLYPALEKPLFSARAMYGIGTLLTIFCLETVEFKDNPAIKFPALVVSWLFFVFCFTYGNALCVQKEYTDVRIAQVIDEIVDLAILNEEHENPVTLQISGSIGYSPVLQNMLSHYNILNRLVPIQFSGPGWYHGSTQFYYYYRLKNFNRGTGMDISTDDLPILIDNMYETIYGDDQYVVVYLKE